ncbi:MAG: putative polysaccharide biosynthesis protein [Vagococcus sp.]
MVTSKETPDLGKASRHMLQGTMILTLTSLIVKILSAVYRVPFQNLVGDEGFYVYQQVYPIYGIGMTLALSGLPVYLSKILAAEKETEKTKQLTSLFFLMVSGVALTLFALIFFGAGWLAERMGDQGLTQPLRSVSFLFLFIPFLASYRGFYQGELNMRPTAFSQLTEQALRVFVIFLAGFLYIQSQLSIYQVGTLAMAGSSVGAVGAFVVLLVMRKEKIWSWHLKGLTRAEIKHFLVRLIKEGGTLCFYSAYLVFFQLVDSFEVKNALVQHGLPELAAKITKGVFDRGQPLVQVGLVVSLSMTTTFLPLLTRYYANHQTQSYEKLVQTFLKLSFMIASAAAFGLALILPFINVTLFKDNADSLALSLYVLSVFFIAMIQVYQTIFQSCNQVMLPLLTAGVGLFVKMLLTKPLTVALGTVGTSLSTLLSLAVCLGLLHVLLRRKLSFKLLSESFYLKMSGILSVMSVLLLSYRWFIFDVFGQVDNRLLMFLLTLVGVFIGIVVVLLGLSRWQVLTAEEWGFFPLGIKFQKILRHKEK